MRKSWKRRRIGMMTGIAIVVALAATAGPSASAETVWYLYDQLGRISTATYPDGKQIVYVYDATGNRTQQIIRVNPAPTAVADSMLVNYGPGVVTFDPRTNDSDAGGDPFTVTSKTNGALGVVTINGGGTSVTYTFTSAWPPQNSGLSDSFQYTITDTYGASATATVSVTIWRPCEPPPGQQHCVFEPD